MVEQEVVQFARLVFSGWGQTKVCEDANAVVREKETRDTTSKVVAKTKQWDSLRARKVIELHGGTEIEGNVEGPAGGHSAQETESLFFDPKHKATWD
eukprot:2574660-Lingulodinium_polyedra.AAC.1